MRSLRAVASRLSSPFAVALLVITALAAALRIPGLGDLPPGLFCDEAANGYNAYSILRTGRDENGTLLPLFVWSFGVSYKNPVFIYAAAGPIALLGLSEQSVRLTAALFGVLGVVSIGVLGRMMMGAAGGLLAALFLAVVPWHVHFSRIGFELISFLPLFCFATAAFLAGVRERPRALVAAAILFGLSLYSYGPAKLFVPLFALGAAFLYARRLWMARGWTLCAVAAGFLTALPAVVFDIVMRERSAQYFRGTTALDGGQSLAENAWRVFDQYLSFFSPAFLFELGDPLERHAVPGFGELYISMAPLVGFGIVWALGRREGLLLLWWLLLYPLAPSLMNEVPSASRGFIGVGAFCLLAAGGMQTLMRVLAQLASGPRLAALLPRAAVVALIGGLAVEAWLCGRAYVRDYPARAAKAFQYGYRETIDFMEKRRADYDVLLLTATDVNQPQIFPAFYNRIDPRRWQRGEDTGYLITDPAEYDRYDMDRRILAALRASDLALFESFSELHRVVDPSGDVEYVIVEPHRRRHFLRDWLLLGPFEIAPNGTPAGAPVEPGSLSRGAHAGAFGPAYWRRVASTFTRVDLNSFYRRTAERAGRSPARLCTYAASQLVAEQAAAGFIELSGEARGLRLWLDAVPLAEHPVPLTRTARRWPVELRGGESELLLELCGEDGEWFFTARVVDAAGRDLEAVEARAALRREPPSGRPPEPAVQIVEGFGRVLWADHHLEGDSDYRGAVPGWISFLYDPDGAVVWETEPLPERASTAVFFTAATSELPGEAELWIDGEYALRFATGKFLKPQRWQRGPYALEYHPQESGHHLSGYWRLLVPAERTTAGRPLQLRVAHVDGAPGASFMIKGRRDTAAREGGRGG